MMRVTLLHHDGEHLGRVAAGTCVGDPYTLSDKGFHTGVESGHLSLLEHIPLHFLIEDVSRALTHQLVRHRIASYSQESQRYVRMKSDDWYIIPDTIIKRGFTNAYSHLMDEIAKFYNTAIEGGIPKEDARYVMPNAATSKIMVTMNGRAFIEAASKRLCKRAQWEIRTLFTTMREQLKEYYPTIYSLAKPPCAFGECKEKHPCGESPYKSS